ncbi:MAG TPA: response regulator [Gemmatimonadales bacterium]|jgi:PAS domain S-box-containing protein
MTASPDAPVPTPRASRTSLIAAPGSATIDATVVEVQVAREQLRRLLGESLRVEIAHLVLIAVVAILLWPSVSHVTLGLWAVVVAVCTAIRAALRVRLRRTDYSPGRAVGGIRLVLAASGLAWGIGAAVVMTNTPLVATALLLVVLCGLAAGGVVSLSGDLWAFRYFLAGLLVPVPIGIVQGAFQRDTAIAILLVGFYAAAMIVFHRASYQLLHEHLQQSFDLVAREHQAVRDRAYLDAVLASAPVAIAVLGGDGRVRGINPQFETLFGYRAAEAIGQDLNELIVPRSELPKAVRYDTLARRGERVSVEVERRRKDGSVVPVMASASHVAGSESGDIFVMYEDISDRRKAQDALSQLANIVQSSDDAIVGQTLDGAVVSWNAAAERMFGYAFAEIKGRNVSVLRPAELVSEANDILERIKRGEYVEHFETVRLRKDGTRVPVSLSISLTRDARGRISGFSTIARDVSSEVASRQALSDARDAAQRLAQTRSSFLANMSHEIRTPMNAILGLTELLLDTELAPEQRHSLTLVQTSAETLLTLLNDILDLSKIEAEHLQLESIAFDLEHLVASTVELLAVRARERRLNLLTDVAPDLPASVRGDPTRLRQILTNLISNAIKFTHQGEVVVAASRTMAPDGRPLLRLAVRDTGIGIPADKLDAIFEEFSQADTSTTRKYGGTGLGLAICRRLVRLMGGELAVSSHVGHGTEFSFAVPLESGAVAAAAAGPTPLAGRRVLVVDDNPTNRRVVLNMLTAVDMEVTEAASGQTALTVLRGAHRDETPFHLAIIDSAMPEMNGFELARAVRADGVVGATPLVMLTSLGQPGDGQRCRDLGIDGYLPKPASRSDLLETLKTVLSGPSAAATRGIVTRHSIAESRRHLQILVAEDNPVNQEVVAAMLHKRGHDIDVVANGRLAVDAVARTRYDVVLMDIQMPEMDGFEATHAIRATAAGKDLPIIALTAHALSGERERCLSHGMTDYLTKPLRAHELFAAVEGWAPSIAPRAEPAPMPRGGALPVEVDAFREQMRLAGAEAAVDQILDTFLESTPQRISAITAALSAGTPGDIERAAHALKSAAGTIGAKSLAALLQQIESAGKAGDVLAARALQDRLEGESAAVLEQLTRLRKAPSL